MPSGERPFGGLPTLTSMFSPEVSLGTCPSKAEAGLVRVIWYSK